MTYENQERTLLKLFIALTTACFMGCSEEPVEGLSDLGTLSNPDDIEMALGKAIDGVTIHTAKVNQYVHYEENYRVDIHPVLKISDISRLLLSIQDTPEKRTYVLEEKYEEFSQSGDTIDLKVSDVELPYTKNAPNLAALKTMSEADPDCGKERKGADGITFDCLKYYNFSTSVTDEPVPEATARRANCGNVPGCKLPSRNISFDQVKFLKGKIVDRENLRFSISKSIPVLFPDMNLVPFNYFCAAKLYIQGKSSFYVNRCTVLRDLSL